MFGALGRGLRDTLDNLLPFTIASLLWWASVLLVVTGPAGTIALFARTDPKRLDDAEAITWIEARALVRRELWRSWLLALPAIVLVIVLASNLRAYAGNDGWVRWLIPLWVVLLLLVIAAGGFAFSLYAALPSPPTPSPRGRGGIAPRRQIPVVFRDAVRIAVGRAFQVLPVMVLLWVIVAIGGVLVVPAILFLPALVACVFNHMTLAALGIPVVNPLQPTPERALEEEKERGGRYSTG